MKTLRYCVALSATTLALAGCGADAKPKFEAEPSSTPTSASPTPDKPEPWKEKSPDGAIAFVEHWVDVFSAAFQTGQTEDLGGLSSADCDNCDGFRRLIEDAYVDGGSITGEAWSVTNARASANPPPDMAGVSADIFQPAQVVEKPGEKPLRTSPGEATYLFELTWVGGWKVSDLRLQEQ